MKRLARMLISVSALLLLGATVVAQPVVAQEADVIAQDLKNLRVPEKVAAVLWTRRREHFTLQILYKDSVQSARIRATGREAAPQPALKPEDTQVWLLRADGTHVSPTDRRETQKCREAGLRCIGYEVQYSFPLSAARDAVAVVMQVDGKFLVDKLERFAD